MDNILLQGGVSGLTLIALVWIVRAVLANNREISKDFNKTITNHLHDETKSKIKLATSLDRLADKIK